MITAIYESLGNDSIVESANVTWNSASKFPAVSVSDAAHVYRTSPRTALSTLTTPLAILTELSDVSRMWNTVVAPVISTGRFLSSSRAASNDGAVSLRLMKKVGLANAPPRKLVGLGLGRKCGLAQTRQSRWERCKESRAVQVVCSRYVRRCWSLGPMRGGCGFGEAPRV